jgi:hypothetical protein
MTKDRAYWGSPEKNMGARPATYLSAARPGGDCVAMISAALAASAVAIQEESLQVADVYLQKAISLYTLVSGKGEASSDSAHVPENAVQSRMAEVAHEEAKPDKASCRRSEQPGSYAVRRPASQPAA